MSARSVFSNWLRRIASGEIGKRGDRARPELAATTSERACVSAVELFDLNTGPGALTAANDLLPAAEQSQGRFRSATQPPPRVEDEVWLLAPIDTADWGAVIAAAERRAAATDKEKALSL